MPRKKISTGTEQARSHLMAIAEQLNEQGIKKAGIVYVTEKGEVGLRSTDEISVIELIYAMRQAEHFVFSSYVEDEDDDDADEDDSD